MWDVLHAEGGDSVLHHMIEEGVSNSCCLLQQCQFWKVLCVSAAEWYRIAVVHTLSLGFRDNSMWRNRIVNEQIQWLLVVRRRHHQIESMRSLLLSIDGELNMVPMLWESAPSVDHPFGLSMFRESTHDQAIWHSPIIPGFALWQISSKSKMDRRCSWSMMVFPTFFRILLSSLLVRSASFASLSAMCLSTPFGLDLKTGSERFSHSSSSVNWIYRRTYVMYSILHHVNMRTSSSDCLDQYVSFAMSCIFSSMLTQHILVLLQLWFVLRWNDATSSISGNSTYFDWTFWECLKLDLRTESIRASYDKQCFPSCKSQR